MQLDDALQLLGAYGRYQLLVYFAISLFDNLPSIWHMNVMTFLGYEQQHRCQVPPGANISQALVYKWQGEERVYDECLMYPYDPETGLYSNDTVHCTHGWHYKEDEPVHKSVVNEWDLVCEKNHIPETSTIVFNVGVMVGGMFFGFISDKFGRKKAFISALLTQCVVGSLTAWSPNIWVFTALRFIVGACEQGVNITGFIMATELFPPKQRTVMAVAHEFIWAAGGALLPIFAYFLRDWRPLQLAISLPNILAIVLIWAIPESLPWLLSRGRVKEAEAIVKKMARVNKASVPDGLFDDHTIQSPCVEDKPMLVKDAVNGDVLSNTAVVKTKTYTLIDCFRTPNLRKISICISFLWALNTLVYYGLTYNTPNLEGNMHLNFFIGQMVEIPSVAVTLWVIYRYGRRWPLCLFHVFGGLVCIASPFVPAQTASGYNLWWVSVTLAMLGKFAINSSFTIIYIYGPEIYPTVLRNTGAALGSSSGRIGGILYPAINYLSKVETPIAKQLPLLVFGILSVIGGFFALPLPETRQRPLPETIEDVENYEQFCAQMAQHEKEMQKSQTNNEMHLITDEKAKLEAGGEGEHV